MAFVIFYSWQSDLPSKTNRGLIYDALKKTVKRLSQDETLNIEDIIIDRDTKGIPGAPDIASTIFKKIRNAQIFVGDISTIGIATHSAVETIQRPTPNPNVLYELGYATGVLGEEYIILVENTTYSYDNSSPFDLYGKRRMQYQMKESEKPAKARANLIKGFEDAIKLILEHKKQSQSTPFSQYDKIVEAIENSKPNQDALIRKYMQNLVKDIDAKAENFLNDSSSIDLFGQAIDSSVELVTNFSKIAQSIAENDSYRAATALYKGFEFILMKQLELENGYWSDYRADIHRFISYELFIVFFSFLLQNERWELIAELLVQTFNIKNKHNNVYPYTKICDITRILHRESGIKYRRESMQIQAEFLSKRYKDGALAQLVSITEFNETELFLTFRAEVENSNEKNLGERELGWYPISAWYNLANDYVPSYIDKAKSRVYAEKLLKPLNAKNIDALKNGIENVKRKIVDPVFNYNIILGCIKIENIGTLS